MKKPAFLLALVSIALILPLGAETPIQSDAARWEQQAQNVTIIRDDWGIPHVYGKTDADAVFGVIYAQAEDDFNRVETNYLNSMGRLAEAEGEKAIYQDLRMKLFIDPADMKAQYEKSPAWLKALMHAWADGLNYYLHTHPQVKPRAITRFEPWMALTFSEGSIGGDIERVNLAQLEAFYSTPRPKMGAAEHAEYAEGAAADHAEDAEGKAAEYAEYAGGAAADHAEYAEGKAAEYAEYAEGAAAEHAEDAEEEGAEHAEYAEYVEPTGSNGVAIAPSNTASKHALLLINPHTSFFFRAEAQMVSEEGLNAYGALTWGQFFIYQGFNERTGWMHTSSGVDNIDEYAETVLTEGDAYLYRYGKEKRRIITQRITVPYKTASGMAKKEFTVYRTHHGPIVREAGGKWIAVRLMQEPLKALTQSYSRTKAHSYDEFHKSMELHTNSSNNTIYADGDGTIAYFHANFIPKRDPKFDWTRPVDGSDPATEWATLLSIEESPLVKNPPVGWLYNSNNWPWSAAGPDSPKRADFASYVDRGAEESPRGTHALRVLEGKKDFTIESLRAAAYDSYLPYFAERIPDLVKAWESAPRGTLRDKLAEQIAMLRDWDFRWSVESVPTSLAVYWGEEAGRQRGGRGRTPSAESPLQALAAASDRLVRDFGTWKTPWGEINRFQRLTGDIVQKFDDSGPSIPVGFTSSRWGSLASFGARTYPGTKKMYGTSGNSFVAVVEFGDRVRAIAVSAGGESGDPTSKHFNDQAARYATGDLREVYFYRPQLEGHTERQYHPGR